MLFPVWVVRLIDVVRQTDLTSNPRLSKKANDPYAPDDHTGGGITGRNRPIALKNSLLIEA